MTEMEDAEDAVGYRRPPVSSRFRKGQSGNPRGRPRGRHRSPPYEAVLGKMVTIREGGAERRITAAEAFLLHVTKKGLEGRRGGARRDGRNRASPGYPECPGTREQAHHHFGLRSTRQREQRARAAAHGPKARPVPRNCADGARALARRGCPREAWRSTPDDRGTAGRSSRDPNASKGALAGLVGVWAVSTPGCDPNRNHPIGRYPSDAFAAVWLGVRILRIAPPRTA